MSDTAMVFSAYREFQGYKIERGIPPPAAALKPKKKEKKFPIAAALQVGETVLLEELKTEEHRHQVVGKVKDWLRYTANNPLLTPSERLEAQKTLRAINLKAILRTKAQEAQIHHLPFTEADNKIIVGTRVWRLPDKTEEEQQAEAEMLAAREKKKAEARAAKSAEQAKS
jgi:hypothetical protein